MSLRIKTAKNVASGWLSLLIHVAVGFFLSPFILHKLGDAAFGLWVLIFSLTGYYGLFDFGIRSSVVRYVARFAASQDADQLTRFLNTSVATYGLVALMVLVVTGIGSFYLGSLFQIPPNLLQTARWLLVLVGTEVALGFPLSVFVGVIEGLQRFSWLNLAQIGCTLIRALFVVIVLNRGQGLLSVALITVTLNLVSHALLAGMAFRVMPLRLEAKFVDRRAFRQMINYGWAAFLIMVAEKLRFGSDAAVIGVFLSSTAITYFAVGLRLVEYPATVVQSLALVFTPMSSHFDALGDHDRLQKVLLAGNRACAMTIFPMCATLIILGKPILEAWVGNRYLSSYAILVALVVPRTLYLAQSASTKILLGMGLHRVLALVLLLEGASNMVLSILLLRHFGILGVAVGTAIPLACTSLFFLPRHVCHLLRVPMGSFLSEAYLMPLVLCAPVVVTLLVLRHSFQVRSYRDLLLQLSAAAVVYGLALLWLFFTREPEGTSLRMRFAQFRQQAFGP